MTTRVRNVVARVMAAAVLLGAGAFLGARISGAGSRRHSVADADRLVDAVACGKGNTAACQRTVATDRARCDRGEFEGCVLLGITYQVGHSVPKDEVLAVNYFRRACDGRNASGCWYLANCYEQARGVAKDEAEARALDAKGCELGTEVNACDSLGALYEYGRGGPKDSAKALAAYDSGCAISKQGFACGNAQRLRARALRAP
jgi:TPR repeat protein